MILFPILLGAAIGAPGVSSPEAQTAALISSAVAASSPAVPSAAAISAAVLQDEEEEVEGLWHGSINVGLSRSEGNADVENYSLDARGVREFEQHRYTLEALWYVSRDNDRGPGDLAFLQRRALASAKYDQFINEKTYFLLNFLIETNFRALLDLRWTVSTGLGYQWRDDDNWKINTEIGVAYFDEEFDTGAEDEYVALRAAWDVWARVTDTVVFGHFAELFPSLEDLDDFYGRATTYFEATLTESLNGRLSWVLTFDNTPATGANGQTLKSADNVYLLTVGWVF